MPVTPLLFSIMLQVIPRTLRQEKEITRIQIEKKEVKLSQHIDDMNLHLKDLKHSIRKILDLIHTCKKVSGYKVNSQRWVALLSTNKNMPRKKSMGENISFTIASKTNNTTYKNIEIDLINGMKGNYNKSFKKLRKLKKTLKKMVRPPLLIN